MRRRREGEREAEYKCFIARIREINDIVNRTYREWAWSSSRHRCNADEDDDDGAESRLRAHRCVLQRDGVRRRCGGVLQRDASMMSSSVVTPSVRHTIFPMIYGYAMGYSII